MCAKSLPLGLTVRHYGWQPARLLCPWDSAGKNSGVGYHTLLQGIFLIQGLKLRLLYLPALAGGFFMTSAPGSSYKDVNPIKSEAQLYDVI